MNNKNTLYIIIGILVILNVAIFSIFVGSQFFNPFSKINTKNPTGMMGHNSGIHDSYDHDHDTSEFNTWEEMRQHMEEMHHGGNIPHKEIDYDKPVAETHKNTHDFGKVKRSEGIVDTTFEIENHGKESLIIGTITTSCGCTSAEIENSQLGLNEDTTLTVYFDPNFHEEPLGKIARSVFVETNDPDLPEMQFDIYVEIVD